MWLFREGRRLLNPFNSPMVTGWLKRHAFGFAPLVNVFFVLYGDISPQHDAHIIPMADLRSKSFHYRHWNFLYSHIRQYCSAAIEMQSFYR